MIRSYQESLHFGDERLLDGLELRRDDRQNGRVDSIELVETSPGATLTQAVQVLADRLVVHALTAIGHHTQQTHRFGQIFHCLRLTFTILIIRFWFLLNKE